MVANQPQAHGEDFFGRQKSRIDPGLATLMVFALNRRGLFFERIAQAQPNRLPITLQLLFCMVMQRTEAPSLHMRLRDLSPRRPVAECN